MKLSKIIAFVCLSCICVISQARESHGVLKFERIIQNLVQSIKVDTVKNSHFKVKKEFPMVMFSVPMENEHFKRVKSIGFNYVHQYGLTNKPYDDDVKANIKKYLDLAYRNQLKVMMNLDGDYRMPEIREEQAFSDFKQIVKDFKDHPALGMWYLFDEPEWHSGTTPEKLNRYYKHLKKESPETPVVICFSTKVNRDDRLKYIWEDFINETDIVAFDTYPVYGQKFPDARLDDVTMFTDKVAKTEKSVMPTLQAFNWQVISGVVKKVQIGTYHIKEAGNNPNIWRYPTMTELRYWAYSSLIQEVDGLMWWSYARSVLNEESDPNWMDDVLAVVIRDVTSFLELVQLEGFHHEDITLSNKNLMAAKWGYEESNIIVIANQTGTSQLISDQIVLEYLEKGELIMQESGHMKIDRTAQYIELAPWQVLILKK